jgi:hypothetical protein
MHGRLQNDVHNSYGIHYDHVDAAERSSNSTCSICCGFVVKQVVQQIHNFRQLSPTTCCATNPQQIEHVEFELMKLEAL